MFNRHKYGMLMVMDALFAFKQLASMDEYAHKFKENMHKIVVYNHSYDETFYVIHFLDSLKPKIRSVIKLHQPSTVDLAFFIGSNGGGLIVGGYDYLFQEI